MKPRFLGLGLLGAAVLLAMPVRAEEHREPGRPGPAMHAPEPHEGPRDYHRPEAPAIQRPGPGFDRGAYQHNFQAARVYHVGPYHRPPGFAVRHWGYGMILPRAYWRPNYLLADYWLFGLEVPPAGYEWVRVDGDAILINTVDGTILQAEYGVFG